MGRVRPGGNYLQFGVAAAEATARFSPYRLFNNEMSFVGSMAVLHSFDRACDLAVNVDLGLSRLVSDSLPISSYLEALGYVRGGKGLKVQVAPSDTAARPAPRTAGLHGRGTRYSLAMAASTSSLAARRAGQVAATRPSTADRTRNTTRLDVGTTVSVSLSERHQGNAHAGPDDDADDGPEDGQDHRLRADHGPHLAPFHAHGPQQADLAGALEHREHQRVDDAHQGDDDGQGEQGVDQAEQLVDAGDLGLFELGPGLHLHGRVGRQQPVHVALHAGAAVGLQQDGAGERGLGSGTGRTPG